MGKKLASKATINTQMRPPAVTEKLRLVAAANAKHQAPMRHGIDHADFGNQAGRVVKRHNHNAGSEFDARSLARQAGQHHQGRWADAVIGKMVLGEPGDVEAGGLGGFYLGDGAVIDRRGGHAAIAIAHQVENADIHGVLPSLCFRVCCAEVLAGSRGHNLHGRPGRGVLRAMKGTPG